MAKFKVGDIVKPNEKADYYGITNRKYMAAGRVTTIWDDPKTFNVEVTDWIGNRPAVVFGNSFSRLNVDCFDLVEPEEELHVTRKGKTTHAVLKKDGKIVKRAQADCNPRDVYDFETGARLAIDRVFGKAEKKAEPKYKFNIGDKVTVVQPGNAYCRYVEFMKQFGDNAVARYAYGHTPVAGKVYLIVERGIHPNNEDLYVIKPDNHSLLLPEGSLYLISGDGLAKAKEETN